MTLIINLPFWILERRTIFTFPTIRTFSRFANIYYQCKNKMYYQICLFPNQLLLSKFKQQQSPIIRRCRCGADPNDHRNIKSKKCPLYNHLENSDYQNENLGRCRYCNQIGHLTARSQLCSKYDQNRTKPSNIVNK